MNRIWDWHQGGKSVENVDAFTAELRKANTQKGLLLAHQVLAQGDIGKSTAMLFAAVHTNPNLTQKVLAAALEMHKYCNMHYAHAKDEVFNAEKLEIPAMIDALEPQITRNVQDASLLGRAKILVSRTKNELQQDEMPTRRDLYDTYISAFKQASITKMSPVHRTLGRKSSVYEI